MTHRILVALTLLVTLPALADYVPTIRPFRATHYKITLQVDPAQDPTHFAATVEGTFKTQDALEKVQLDSQNLTIGKVIQTKPSRHAAQFETKGDLLEITLPRKLKKGETFRLEISYEGKINSSHDGFFKVKDPDEPARGPLLFTMFEANHARSFFPCDDQPFDKATTEMVVTVPEGISALSNGKLVKDRPVRKNGKAWHEAHWKLNEPQSTYLVSLAVGSFGNITTQSHGKPISIWTGKAKLERARYALSSTKHSFEFFESYLGTPYPWPKYATIGIPTFLWGGMENTSATHMNQERILLDDPRSELQKKTIVALAAHELAHQWFGDYVTMKWWDDVWLNESFASLMATLATADAFHSQEATIDSVLGVWYDYFRQEDGPRSHPIVDKHLAEVDDAFDSINYTKGENVLRMLSHYIGEDKFRAGVKAYLQAHAFGNATYVDLFDSLSKVAGESLVAFRDSWLLQRGYPVVTYSGSWKNGDKGAGTYTLRLNQRSNHATDKSLFVLRMPVAFHRRSAPSYDVSEMIEVKEATVAKNVSLPAEPEWVTVNPGSPVLAKVVPEEIDEDRLANQALEDPDLLGRIWAAYTLSAGLREGKDISKQSQKTLAKVLRDDASPYVRNAVLISFRRNKTRWLPDRIGDAVLELAKAAAAPNAGKTPLALSDPHGWAEWRAEVLGALGRVDKKEVLPFLAQRLDTPDLPLDELSHAAYAVANLGDPKSGEILKAALKRHQARGYRFQFVVLYAFGSLESPTAASEIRKIAETAGSDLMGRLGGAVRDNHTLLHSTEWPQFLQTFVLEDKRFGEEVKARLLDTVEEVRTPAVKGLLQAIVQNSRSPRMKEVARKMLEKNFRGDQKT